jgi:tetratricopeptide (TPR) repeat protein
MEKTSELVSSFIQGLESHPNGEELISVIEDILAADSIVIDPVLINSLLRLSSNNLSLLVDFWILRGTILKEEGRDFDSIRTFFEAARWVPNNPGPWLRIVEIFTAQQDLLKALFFLSEAQECLDSPSAITEEIDSLMQQLEVGLAIPPGFPESLERASDPEETTLPPSSSPKVSFNLPSQASNLWDQALECYHEGTTTDNIIYLQAFIHYAHSTVREVLGLDGNFKEGIDRKIAQYGLFEFKSFFYRLNSLRNAVIHDGYLLFKEEAIEIHDHVVEFLSFMQKQ